LTTILSIVYITLLILQPEGGSNKGSRNVYLGVKAVPLQALRSPEGSRKLRFPDFVTTAQDGGRLSVLHIGR